MNDVSLSSVPSRRSTSLPLWIFDVLLILVLLVGVYFRTLGLDWDQNEHLHPDERFLTMVETSIAPVKNLSEYFNTNESTLNPHNRGYSFFVYGTLPIFIVRYVAEWMNMTGYGEIYLVGRALSAMADILTVFLVYLIGTRMYDRRVGVLAAAFSAFAVLQIQLSHFFTVDTFTNFFTFLAFYFGVRVLLDKRAYLTSAQINFSSRPQGTSTKIETSSGEVDEIYFPVQYVPITTQEMTLQAKITRQLGKNYSPRDFLAPSLPFILFGIALGMAMASKVSAAPLALLLPAAAALRLMRMEYRDRIRELIPTVVYLVLAGIISFLTFRIFQPYAFSGPGIFGILPNQQWLDNLRELQNQSHLDADPPFAFQWARRPITFSWTNMVLWGLGLPLGMLAWSGFFWMGWKIIKGSWKYHSLIWGWTAVYFSWQAINWVRSMRYQLLVYPTLALIAAWAIITLWDRHKVKSSANGHNSRRKWVKVASVVIGATVLASTFAWAFAFTRIYAEPVTRVQASHWVYQNIPAPINVIIETDTDTINEPLAVRKAVEIRSRQPYRWVIKPEISGYIVDVTLPHVANTSPNVGDTQLGFEITSLGDPIERLGYTEAVNSLDQSGMGLGPEVTATFDAPVFLKMGKTYILSVELVRGTAIPRLMGSPTLSIIPEGEGEVVFRQSLPIAVQTFSTGKPLEVSFRSPETGQIREVSIPYLLDQSGVETSKTIRLQVEGSSGDELSNARSEIEGEFGINGDARGQSYQFTLDHPVPVLEGEQVNLEFQVVGDQGEFAVRGSAPIIEEPWDDPIPVGIGKYSPYDDQYGLYRNDLNVVMYWDDNQDKLDRLYDVLDQADNIFITSNRQWGSTTRVPERYPLTSAYYRSLLGCPPEKSITWCYSVAEPGMFTGQLGFRLIQTFQSNPTIGPFEINDQFAEEAFTVYDHPKVLIFEKTSDYDQQEVREILGAVDLDMVMRITPRRVTGLSQNLMLPTERLTVQKEGGTWSHLFDTQSIQNRYPAIGLILWYLAIWVVGIVVYPLTRLALPGLADRGYPFTRITGMLLLAYLVWLGGSFGITTTPLMISIAFSFMVVLGLLLTYRQREDLVQEWNKRKGYFLTIELLTLAFFTIDLLIRIGNPDLWHPAYGGERPMNFSYFNAIVKSSTFPPYDPWFAGGFINYYYYGYVIVGVITKWLGITPSVAYNLILPTLFSILATGAFSLGWNIILAHRKSGEENNKFDPDDGGSTVMRKPLSGVFSIIRTPAFLTGIFASIAMVLLGNLGTVRMIWHGLQRLVAPEGMIDGINIITRLVWTVRGFFQYLNGVGLPYSLGQWYWIPSRAIPAPNDVEPITEFPLFTFLYGDLHAHLVALPITLLVLAWVLSVILSKGQWGESKRSLRLLGTTIGFLLAGLVIGSLRPTNTWDFPTYLLLGVLALGYTSVKYFDHSSEWLPQIDPCGRRITFALFRVGVLIGLTLLFYLPYSWWYRQGYNAVDIWENTHTPFWSYITHWGLFLFIIVSWMVVETRNWMATTPASALRKLRPFQGIIIVVLLLVLGGVFLLSTMDVRIAWLILPLALWAGVLILRPGIHDVKRLVLFLVLMGLGLTLFVEVFVLRGDIGRMNTVFKFYIQVWTFFAISAAASLAWMIQASKEWRPNWHPAWQTILILLIGGASLYPISAISAKIRDRMAPAAPHSLDSMTYMQYAHYNENWGPMDLSEDYRAIRWMQENVVGSPVIVEANVSEYRWGSRYSIYTGLPGVVGWNWHQRQQRSVVPSNWINDRVEEIGVFYQTGSIKDAEDFIKKYNVEFIIVGQQERGIYPGPGLDKFETLDGTLWDEVYRDGETVIYLTKCNCDFGQVSMR